VSHFGAFWYTCTNEKLTTLLPSLRIGFQFAFAAAAGWPDGLFQTKNPNLGNFGRALEWKMLVYFMTVGNVLRPFGLTYGRLV
jgi:hypothetical protein